MLLIIDAGNRNISSQGLVSGNKMETQSVIVSKPYSVSTTSTTSTYRGIGHSITRLAESEKGENQVGNNHAQFYGMLSLISLIIFEKLFLIYIDCFQYGIYNV